MSTSSRSGDCHVIRIEDFDKLKNVDNSALQTLAYLLVLT